MGIGAKVALGLASVVKACQKLSLSHGTQLFNFASTQPGWLAPGAHLRGSPARRDGAICEPLGASTTPSAARAFGYRPGAPWKAVGGSKTVAVAYQPEFVDEATMSSRRLAEVSRPFLAS